MMSPDTSPDIATSIKRRLNVLTATVVVFCLIVSGGVVYVVVTAAQTHDALCTFRADLQNRVSQSQDFLAHPDKYPGIHIDPTVIQTQVDSQKRTVASLSGLGCG